MAGYGNKKATDPTYEEGDDSFRFGRHTSTDPYVDAREYGSGTTGGAGFGNKTNSATEFNDDGATRFGSHSNTDPYSGHTEFGSGTTGGAGYGNKTGGHRDSQDSTVGKVMQKAGGLLKSESLVEKGIKKRESKSHADGSQ